MKDDPKKPDLRDRIYAPPTAIDTPDRTFAEEPLQSDARTPDIVKPGPEVQTPGQTTKQ
jgi:hypothetical protein